MASAAKTLELTHHEINLLLMGLMTFQEKLEKEKRPRAFRSEKARNRALLPQLIAKINHAKNITVTPLGDRDVDCAFISIRERQTNKGVI